MKKENEEASIGENENSGEEDEDNIDDMFEGLVGKRDVWQNTANIKIKNEIIRELIRCFGSMISTKPKEFSLPDNKGKFKCGDLICSKLLDASKYVVRAKNAILKNENFDTREFTLYIASKRWVHNILQPLLSLCSDENDTNGDDTGLAMRCCGLAIVLLKRLSDNTVKVLNAASGSEKNRKRTNKVKLVQNSLLATEKSRKNDDENESDKDDERLEDEKIVAVDRANQAALLRNAKMQVSALLSFKDALSQGDANAAICSAFKLFWLQEQQVLLGDTALLNNFNSEDNKQGVAICFSYVRRLLAIRPHKQFSAEGEAILCETAHHRCIVQLRFVLSVLPGVCSDILRSYHDDWLSDILLIIFYSIQGFEVKEMFEIWKSGALSDDLDEMSSFETEHRNSKIFLPAAIPDSMLPTRNSADRQLIPSQLVQNSTKGLLSNRRKEEGLHRKAVLTSNGTSSHGMRSGKFTGMFTIATNAHTRTVDNNFSTPPANEEDAMKPKSQVLMPQKQYLTNPFMNPVDMIPQAKQRRGRNRATFSSPSTTGSGLAGSNCGGLSAAGVAGLQERHKACVVVASLVNLLSLDLALKPLVKRVNEDLRRDEMRVGPELELRYFELLASILKYNRLKLRYQQAEMVEKHKQLLETQSLNEQQPFLWTPYLVNVMDALDRMSFRRVVAAIERTMKSQHMDDVVVPMTLFKEMVSYLRVLLESSIEGHHEIAIAAIYRLFYASSDRLDPLPKLLSDWKAGTFSRRHLEVLVELVHETLKVLDATKELYKVMLDGVDGDDEEALQKKLKQLKKKKGKSDLGMELYVTSCLRFNVDDYFKRIASNHSVMIYTKLLNNYKINDVQTNHHIYCFLRRMCTYNLEQYFHVPLPAAPTVGVTTDGSAAQATSSPAEPVNLGYMLFNSQTFCVISTVLNDPTVQKLKSLEPLIRLLKSIVRRFAMAASRNHLLFVEALFQHPRPSEHCCLIDNLYEVSTYMPNAMTATQPSNQGEEKETEVGGALPADIFSRSVYKSSRRGDFGEELDDEDLEMFNSNSTDAATSAAAESTPEDEAVLQRRQRLQKVADRVDERKSSAGVRRNAVRWSVDEDAVLRRLYDVYAGASSVFTSIAQSDELLAESQGVPRTAAQVAQRVKQLQLDHQDEDKDEVAIEKAGNDVSNSSGDLAVEMPEELLGYSQSALSTLSAVDLLDLDRQMESSSESDEEKKTKTKKLDGKGSKRSSSLAELQNNHPTPDQDEVEGERVKSAKKATVQKRQTLNKRAKRVSTNEDSEDDGFFAAPVDINHIYSNVDINNNDENFGLVNLLRKKKVQNARTLMMIESDDE